MCKKKKFPFTYDGIANINSNLGHNIKEFWQGWFVAVKFNAHSINFRTKINPESTLNYNFCLQSIYLVERDESKPMYIPAKQEQDPDN